MNNPTPKALMPFIDELKEIHVLEHDDLYNIEKVSSILKHWITRTDWLEERFHQVNPDTGFSSWLIHEEEDHSLAVNLVAWEPMREITPHDHKTWGVVGCVVGIEENYFWSRLDDGLKPGYAQIKRQNPAVQCHPGDIISFTPNKIHSVINTSSSVAISLHVYGKNLNYTHRFQYNPEAKTVKTFIVDFK